MMVLAFPILYFNERRATKPHGRHDAAHAHDPEKPPDDPKGEGYKQVGEGGAGAATDTEDEKSAKDKAKEKADEAKQKAKELGGKASEKADEAVHRFEEKVCSCFCCKAVDKCCDKIPEKGNVGYQTWCIRFLGFFMIWIGANMFLYPLYFILHCIWFVGPLIAVGIAGCVCKLACCGWMGTMCTSYSIHRPLYLIAFVVACIVLLAVNIFFMGAPEQHHGPVAAAPPAAVH